MFKKPFTVNQTHKVSGADRKKLKRSLEKSIPSSEECDWEVVLPSKAGDFEVNKLAAPSRISIYLLDKVPVFVDTSGKNDIAPTIFTLWKAPNMLPRITLKHYAVSQYVIGGADLMLPGVDDSALPTFAKDDLVSVCVPGNPMPIAVGVALISSEEAKKRAQGSQVKGKLVEVIQAFGDCLWSDMGGKGIPNDSFYTNAVVPLGLGADAPMDHNIEGQTEPATSEAPAEATEEMEKLCLDITTSNQQAEGANAASAAEDPGASTGSAASPPAFPQDMDELLNVCLLEALHRAVKDEDLPMNSSVLWNQYMLPSRPAGSVLDIKKSSHKKMSKFLQSYGKCKLLHLKEDKHSGDTIVTGINRTHKDYTSFRPYALVKTAGLGSGSEAAASSSSAAAHTPVSGTASSTEPAELVIDELYKPGKEMKAVFEALGLKMDALYSGKEAGEVALTYVKEAKLEDNAPDDKTIVLDAALCDALYKGVVKKGEIYPTHIAKAALREAFQARMHLHFRVRRGHNEVVRKGSPPQVNISVDKRQGNKRVTRVVGTEAFLVDPDMLAAVCQKMFACSSSVAPLPGKNQGSEVVIQGNVPEKVTDYLTKVCGVPYKCISVKS